MQGSEPLSLGKIMCLLNTNCNIDTQYILRMILVFVTSVKNN